MGGVARLSIDWSDLGIAYKLLMQEIPDAIHFPSSFGGLPRASHRGCCIQFTTLTTLSYGDAYPVHRIARSMAIAEGLIGQLYPAILIATLVGMALQSRSSAPADEPEN